MSPESVESLHEIVCRARSVDEFLLLATEYLHGLTGADAVEIFVPTPNGGLTLRASHDNPELSTRFRIGPGVGLVGVVFESQKPITITSGLNEDERHQKMPGDETEYDSAVVTPLLCGDECLGVIRMRKKSEWPLDMEVYAELEQEIQQLGTVFAGFNAGYEAGSQTDRLEVLSEVTRTLTDSPYLEEILQLLVNLTARRFNYRVVTVRLLDETQQELILRATQATNRAYQRKRAIKLGESIAGQAIEKNQPIYVKDVQSDPDYIGHDLAEQQGLHSMICVPLTIQGRPVGVMSCYSGETRAFTDDEVAALETIAKQAAVSIEHAKLQVRNTLMQEMHHRVKNNLQQVASLLRLQMRQSHYKTLNDALEDSLGRILAIASVHELLSRDDLDHVSVKHIAETLVNHQQQSFLLPGKKIGFSVQGDEVYLNTTQATQIALVLNELIQNAVEHGFKESSIGTIKISVENNDDDIVVWVSNDGDQLPADFDPKTTGQLGLQIIRSLSKGLGGAFTMVERDGWTIGEVRFTRQAAE
ncbi:MAG: GAF domain-containing protein [Armatimonadetes bacterium]|nr:GAF domain-containing protein [Armatimonadota bacterium]